MRKPTYRENLRSTTRDIAHVILTTSGLKELQARKVASAADCSVGTLYNLWRNLDELIIAANAVTLGELGATLVRARDATVGLDGLEPRLIALADAYVAFAVEKQNSWRAVFDHRMADAGTVPDWYREAQATLFAIVESILEPFITEPERRTRAAHALFASVHGIVALALDEKLGSFDRAECERQVHFIVAAISRGIMAGTQFEREDSPSALPT